MNQPFSPRPSVGLLVTCLVDLLRPNIGFAAMKLLHEASCDIAVPSQTCCGQPSYNSGDLETTKNIARQVIDQFEFFDYVVVPSGSCAGMLIKHYPKLFETEPKYRNRAIELASRTRELVSLLVNDIGYRVPARRLNVRATYHDSCAGLRELGIKGEPRSLLESIEALELTEMSDSEVCCGFGGTFCVKYGDISARMVSEKIGSIEATSADFVLGGDLGCLLNIAGCLSRVGSKIAVYHVAEVASDMIAPGPIGKDAGST